MQVSLETIRRRLNEVNVYPRRPTTGPLLKAAYRRARLEFARTHVGWNPHEWERVLFSHDSCCCLHSSDRLHIPADIHEVGLQVMQWPAPSPDLNPIELVWDMVARRIGAHEPSPATFEDVGNQLVQIWNALDQEDIRRIIVSMPERYKAVIRCRGGNTRF